MMFKIKTLLLIPLLFAASLALSPLLGPTTQSAPTEINPEIDRIEKGLETKIYQALKTFLGEETKIIVAVRAIESPQRPVAKPLQNDNGVDILYAPTPYMADLTTHEETKKNVVIDSVSISAQIGGDVDAATLTKVKTLIAEIAKGFTTDIRVTAFEILKKSPSAKNPNEPATPNQEPFDFKKMLPYLVALLAAMIIAIGIAIIGYAIRASASSLVSGLTHIFSTNKTNIDSVGLTGSDDKPLVLEHRNADLPQKKKPDSSTAAREYDRNIRIIKEMIKEAPMILIKSINDSADDLRGLKWLFPHLSADENTVMRRYLGPSRISAIANLDLNTKSTETIELDYTGWLQDFVERMMLKKIEDKNLVESSLGSERSVTLYLAKPEQLLGIAQELNTPAAWRVLSEFVSNKSLEDLTRELPSDIWDLLVQGARESSANITRAADQFITRLKALETQQADQKSSEDRAQYFAKTLLNPVIASLQSKNLDEGEFFLNQFEQEAPELVQMVRQKVWTPSMLSMVSPDDLKNVLRSLTNEQRTAILYMLPQRESEMLQNLLPVGNVRTIVADQLDKMRKRQNPKDLKDALTTARQFLERLRVLHEQGKITLVDDGTRRLAA